MPLYCFFFNSGWWVCDFTSHPTPTQSITFTAFHFLQPRYLPELHLVGNSIKTMSSTQDRVLTTHGFPNAQSNNNKKSPKLEAETKQSKVQKYLMLKHWNNLTRWIFHHWKVLKQEGIFSLFSTALQAGVNWGQSCDLHFTGGQTEKSQEPLWPHNPGINTWEELLVKSVKPLPLNPYLQLLCHEATMEKSIKEQGKWKREKPRSYWLIKAQWRMMEVWTLPLHQAEQGLFWAPGGHGMLAVTDSAGTPVRCRQWRTRVCILQDYKTRVTPKLWTAPLHRKPSYKAIIHSFEHPTKLLLWL